MAIRHYKGRFGDFDYNDEHVDFVLDELTISEIYHSRWQGDYDEDYYDDIHMTVFNNPEENDMFIEKWVFNDEVPKGFVSTGDYKYKDDSAKNLYEAVQLPRRNNLSVRQDAAEDIKDTSDLQKDLFTIK